MKRLIVLFVLTGLLALGAPGQASKPGVGVIAYQFADATWTTIKGDRGTFLFAVGAHFAWDGPPITFGVVGTGTCRVERGGNFKIVMCHGSGRAKEIPMQDFQVDPLLGSASLTLESYGRRHDVQWTGKGSGPSFGMQVGGGGTQLGAGAGLGRWATASGKLMGKRYAKGSDDGWSMLSEGADVMAYALFEDFSDGTFEFERTFKIPR